MLGLSCIFEHDRHDSDYVVQCWGALRGRSEKAVELDKNGRLKTSITFRCSDLLRRKAYLRAGFTLIELVVVIGVMGLLASILLPALSRAKEKAQGVACLNNMKQLQLAWQIYSHDNLDMIPALHSWVTGIMTYDNNPDNTNIVKLLDAIPGGLGPNVKAARIYKCPADKSWVEIDGQRFSRVRSYSMSAFMGEECGCLEDHFKVRFYSKTTDIRDPPPSDVIVFVDEFEDSIRTGIFLPFLPGCNDCSFWEALPGSRHSRACVFSFADGHVGFKKWSDPRTVVPSRVQPRNRGRC